MVSDRACPWCCTEKRSLRKGYVTMEKKLMGDEMAPAFELDPTTPSGRLTTNTCLQNKFGNLVVTNNMATHKAEAKKEERILFNSDEKWLAANPLPRRKKL